MAWFFLGAMILYATYCCTFIFFQSFFIFRPEKLPADYVFNPGISFREINIHADDGTTLNGLLLQPEAMKGTVIYFHGNWKNLDNYLPFTKKFTDLGYSVLIPDYRSYGKSDGKLTEKNFYSDTQHWYSIAREYQLPEKIFIYGRSLGTAAAAYLASQQPCKQLILETPFSNMYDIARRYGMPFNDGSYLSFGFRTDLIIQSITAPIIILHGTKDETVSIHSGKKLMESLKEGDRFVEIANGRHKNLDQFNEYHLALDEVLNADSK